MDDSGAALPDGGRPTAAGDGTEASCLSHDRLGRGLAVRDWLLAATTRQAPWADLLAGLAERLGTLDVPVDRLTTAIDALHSEYTGIGRLWTREGGFSFRLFPHGEESEAAFRRSPFRQAHETGEWLLLDVAETADDAYGIVPELKEAGYAQYLVVPLLFTNGSRNGVSFASRTPDGFGPEAIAALRFVMPTLAAAIELRSMNQRLDTVLRIYVGDEPHKEILSGAIRRGQVNRIRSSILFADMRSYTRITSALPPEDAVALLNTFFDCLVPPIESEGGEVLKYMGDGLLAIFRDRGDDTAQSAGAALASAVAGLVRLDEANREGRFPTRIEAGIALHHGEAAYGNVGSGQRLDFTVIGPDVNLASRIAQCNKKLGEPLLMSRAFADRLWGDPEPLGLHELDGIGEAVPIFRLRQSPDQPPAGPDATRPREPSLA